MKYDDVIVIIGMGLVLGGFWWAVYTMSRKLDSITAHIEHETLRYRKRACDVACGGRTLLDERESDKLLRVGYAYYLTKDKEKKIAEDEALIKKMQESKDMVEAVSLCGTCHSVSSCANRDDSVTKCIDYLDDGQAELSDDDEEQEATDEQQRVEGAEEVGENRLIPELRPPTPIDKEPAGSAGVKRMPSETYTQATNHRTAAEKIAEANKKAANPADEAVEAIKKTLEHNFGDKTKGE